jgi:5'-deoxynucleotidase YfbR-like HD superfamily hydrolase
MNVCEHNDWMTTYTGKKVYPANPKPEDICLEDIAHALSQTCRFGGHTVVPYYVSQHSIIVADNVPESLRAVAILHDAPEYILGDVVAPLKRSMPDYKAIEDRVWSAVCCRFGIDSRLLSGVKTSDLRALMTERRDVLAKSSFRWNDFLESLAPFDNVIVPLSSVQSKYEFLRYCELLGLR